MRAEAGGGVGYDLEKRYTRGTGEGEGNKTTLLPYSRVIQL